MALSLNEKQEQWFTLFDYLEDDIFDGNLGENDSETPMIQVRYYLTDSPLSRTTYESRKEETVTRTTVSSGSRTTTTTTTVTTNSTSESSDNYSVKTLTTDLRKGLDTLKEDLKAEQNDLHSYEDSRADTLAHLENVHNELEKEHINDQVRGEELRRLDKEISSEIDIATSQVHDEKESLQRRINHVDQQINEVDPIVKTKENENRELASTLGKDENVKDANLSEAATGLRKDNNGLRQKIEDSNAKVKSERDEKVKVFNQHADLVNTYNDLVNKYQQLLTDVEVGRKDAERDYNATLTELDSETANQTNLDHHINSTDKGVNNHKVNAEALKRDLDALRKHYGNFETQFNQFVAHQNDEVQRLNDLLRTQESDVTNLQQQLSESAKKIVDLHASVDKENAANLNAKLSHLIGVLVDVDKSRRQSQNSLENAQEKWTAKLKLFEDEASRMSRENANKKRAAEVENLLNKLDRLNKERNEIARERDELEAKVVTDGNRDVLNSNLEKELEGLNLKLRWANDEIVKTHNDLTDLLKFLDFKRNYLNDQEEQITTLRTEITEIRTRITECNTTITELEGELAELNLRIEELLRQIAQLDDEIEELNRILAERLQRIRELESQLKITSYVAVKGDMVDELLAQYIQNCPVPVKRLGGGFYLFGLRKIYAKIMNGKLVIRVGGGYMVIEKFIETYAEQELQKLMRVAEKEGVSSFMELDLEAIALGPKSPTGRSPTAKSPTGKSPKASFNASGTASAINGTNRKTFKAPSSKAIVRQTGTTTTTSSTTLPIQKIDK